MTIDPTIVVTTTADFLKSNNEGMISFDMDEISRAVRRSGTTGSWYTTTGFTTARFSHTSVVYNGYLYVIGGSNVSNIYNDVQFAPINADGTIGSWTATTSFTSARQNHTSVAYNGYLYVLGGWNGITTYYNTVQYAPINANGTVGTWTATTSFTTGRRSHTSVVYNGYLYVIGGMNGSASFLNDVQYAPINANGTVGAWTATTSFTTARSHHTSVAYNSYLYVLGGYNPTILNDVQFAPINANGTVGTWITTNLFTTARYGHASAAYNGYLYVIGGSNRTENFNDVQYAPINANGRLGNGTYLQLHHDA